MDRIPPVALGFDNGVGNVAARQRLLCPPELEAAQLVRGNK
jgi:hypothetical protein